jgi:SAM-dependent methyltransferase
MAEPNAPEHFSEWNEQMVARHDPELFHNHPRWIVRSIENARVSRVLRLLDAGPSHTVLELGSGAGNVIERAAGGKKFALDLSRRMSQRALKRLGRKASVVQADGEAIPFRDATIDRVICSSVLSHALNPEKLLAESFRVLKPGGRLVVSVSTEASIERGLKIARTLGLNRILLGRSPDKPQEDVYNREYHLHRFDVQSLREAAVRLPKERTMTSVRSFLFPVHLVALYVK